VGQLDDGPSIGNAERRRRTRMTVCVPALVRGTDDEGRKFFENRDRALLNDLSAGGALLHLPRPVEVGQVLLVIFTLSHMTQQEAAANVGWHIALKAQVRRVESQSDRGCRVGVQTLRHRFLYGGDAAPIANA